MAKPPDKLGKYEITGILGKGGMGTVYQGVDPVIQRTVAIKTIHKELIDDGHGEAMIERFKNEARAAGRLNHPGIVAIYDYGEAQDVSYIAMEYVNGCGLNEFIRDHKKEIPLCDIVSIMMQLLAALDYAHEQGVVHRDIKAANLLITSDGKLKITDFGIARLDTSHLTMVGSIIGTPNSMAPEQFKGLTADRRTDVFAAGVVFYEMLTGQRPFSGTMETMPAKVCFDTEVPPSSLNADIPQEFDVVSARALAKLQEDRFQTTREFSEALQEVYESTAHTRASLTVSDRTVILTEQAVQASLAAMRAKAEKIASGSGTGQTSLPGQHSVITNWPESTLKDVEKQLAAHVGPLAKVIVRKAASTTTSMHDLFTQLAGHIKTDAARHEFLGSLTRLAVTAPPTSTGLSSSGTKVVTRTQAATQVVALPQATLDTATRELTKMLGPIASVMIKKAAREAGSVQDFHALLAENLHNPDQRSAFLKSVKSS